MIKNKICVLSSTFLLGITLFSCGGGNKPTPTPEVKVKEMAVSLKDTTKKYYFGDKITKDEFVVTLSYTDGTSKTLTSDEFKVCKMLPFGELKEVTFPHGLEYSSFFTKTESLTFVTNDGASAKSFNLSVNKKYNFDFCNDIEPTYISISFTDATQVKFTNTVKLNGETVEGVTYKAAKANQINVGETSGEITILPTFSGSTVYAYLDGVKIDEYTVTKFGYKVDGMQIEELGTTEKVPTVKCTIAEDKKATYNPNEDGKLYIPCLINDSGIALAIGDNSFAGCTAITYLSLPSTINAIGAQAFKDCTAIAKTIDIGANVAYIGPHAFENVSAPFDFADTEGWYWYYTDDEGETYEYGAIDSKYLEDKEIANKILTDYCLDCALIKIK